MRPILAILWCTVTLCAAEVPGKKEQWVIEHTDTGSSSATVQQEDVQGVLAALAAKWPGIIVKVKQRSNQTEVYVKECQMQVTRLALHCTDSKNAQPLLRGFGIYFQFLSANVCMKMHDEGSYAENGINVNELVVNQVNIRSVQISGHFDKHSDCVGAVYRDALGGPYSNAMVQGIVKITLLQYTAEAKEGILHLQDGRSCKFEGQQCTSGERVTTVWQAPADSEL